MKLKKYYQLSMIALIVLLIFSCEGIDGQDGADGRAAIAYSWIGNIWDVWSNDPTIPQTFTNGTYYYFAEPGTYSYGYSGDGGSWTGYYTIWINEGEPGEPGDWFWQDGASGADGEDMFFELFMYSYIGPSFYEWYSSTVGINLPRKMNDHNEESDTRYLDDSDKELKNYKTVDELLTLEKLDKVKFSNLDEYDIIERIDNNPNTVVESGRIGKYKFIHKYMKADH